MATLGTTRARKNVLDLEYNRFLQYSTASLVLMVSLFVAVAVAYVSGQIVYGSDGFHLSMFFLFILFSLLVSILVFCSSRMREILAEIREMRRL